MLGTASASRPVLNEWPCRLSRSPQMRVMCTSCGAAVVATERAAADHALLRDFAYDPENVLAWWLHISSTNPAPCMWRAAHVKPQQISNKS